MTTTTTRKRRRRGAGSASAGLRLRRLIAFLSRNRLYRTAHTYAFTSSVSLLRFPPTHLFLFLTDQLMDAIC